MEENQKRKKKIKKWIKFSCWIAFGLLLIIIGVTGCVKTNAMDYDYTQETPTWTYNPYQFFVTITRIDNYHNSQTNEDGYVLDCEVYANTFDLMYYVDNAFDGVTWTITNKIYGNSNLSFEIYWYDTNILAYNNETIDIVDINLLYNPITQSNNYWDRALFLMSTNANNVDDLIGYSQSNDLLLYEVTNANNWINYNTGYQYQSGYSAGISESDVNTAYVNGYDQGYRIRENQYRQQLEQQQANYDKAINSANAETQRWKDLYESGTTPWGSFKGLLGMIVTFPIQWFKEGLDVNIFGVNVGGFILGIGIIIIILTIIGLFKGRGTRNE